jgi:hypothetical protein
MDFMAKKLTEIKNGRPEKPIDWELVDKLLIVGCSGTEIAPHFNIHPDTLYKRIEDKYNKSFTTYSAEMFEKGNSVLRQAQYDKAASGDNTMMVWLGKNRLKQRENPTELTVSNETVQTFKEVMAQVKSAQIERKEKEQE